MPYDMPVDFLERSHARQQKPRLNLNQLRQQVDLARQPLPGFSGAGLFFDTPESVQGVRIPGAARSANPTIQRALDAPTPEELAKVALEQRQAAQAFRQQAGIPEGAPIGVSNLGRLPASMRELALESRRADVAAGQLEREVRRQTEGEDPFERVVGALDFVDRAGGTALNLSQFALRPWEGIQVAQRAMRLFDEFEQKVGRPPTATERMELIQDAMQLAPGQQGAAEIAFSLLTPDPFIDTARALPRLARTGNRLAREGLEPLAPIARRFADQTGAIRLQRDPETFRELSDEIARLERKRKPNDSDRANLEYLQALRYTMLEESLAPDEFQRYIRLQEELDMQRGFLRERTGANPAPPFGSPERAEWEAERMRRAQETGRPIKNMKRQREDARARIRDIEAEIADIERRIEKLPIAPVRAKLRAAMAAAQRSATPAQQTVERTMRTSRGGSVQEWTERVTVVHDKYRIHRNAPAGAAHDLYGQRPVWVVSDDATGEVIRGGFRTKKDAIEWANAQAAGREVTAPAPRAPEPVAEPPTAAGTVRNAYGETPDEEIARYQGRAAKARAEYERLVKEQADNRAELERLRASNDELFTRWEAATGKKKAALEEEYRVASDKAHRLHMRDAALWYEVRRAKSSLDMAEGELERALRQHGRTAPESPTPTPPATPAARAVPEAAPDVPAAAAETPRPPQRVFHGSQNVFERFDPGKSNPDALYGPGAYFTEDPNVASGYARTRRSGGAAPNVTPARLNIQRPFDIDAPADANILRVMREIEADNPSAWDNGLDAANIESLDAITTNGDLYEVLWRQMGNKAEANDFLAANGFDSITHIGGARTGTAPHRVWIVLPDPMTGEFGARIQPGVSTAETQTQQIGQMQAGFGIGERPTQGQLLGETLGEGQRAPLADPEQMLLRQQRQEEIARGQQEMPVDVLEARETPAAPAAAAPTTTVEAGGDTFTRTTPAPQPGTTAQLPATPNAPPAQPPTAPPGGTPPPGPPDEPPSAGRRRAGPAPEVVRSLQQAAEIVRLDKPGALAKLTARLPVIGRLRKFERPALDNMPDHILTAHVAEGAVQAEFQQITFASRQQLLRRVDELFGEGAVDGGVTRVKFLGTDAQRNPFVGTVKDIADRPHLYQLTPQQASFLEALERRNTTFLNVANEGYGAEIGQFRAAPGGAYLPNIDRSDEALAIAEAMGISERRRVTAGRSKPRIFDTAHDRWLSDPEFKPELSLRRLLHAMDESKARAAAAQTFRAGVGGLTRLEVMRETHPALAARMELLQQRLASLQAKLGRNAGRIDEALQAFNNSAMETEDILVLQEVLDLELSPGFHAMDLPGLQAEIAAVKQQIQDLLPAWENANVKPYVFVGDGIFRYFPAEEAKHILELRKMSNSGFLRFLDEWRQTVLAGDTSPFTGVQAPLGFLFDPAGVARQFADGIRLARAEGDALRAFRLDALADDVAADPQSWADFAYFTGRAIQGTTPEEFAGGLLMKIPGFRKANEAMYIGVARMMKRQFDDIAFDLMQAGVPRLEALAVAGDMATKVYPMLNPRRLGQSAERAAIIRALPTSVSFVRQPPALMMDATRGFAKLAARKKLTPQEKVAVRLMTTLAASTMTASIVSHVLSAAAMGDDIDAAIAAAIDPNSPSSYSVKVGNRIIPIGGPFRGLLKAIWPREVEGVPVPVPFAGIPNWITARLNPALRTQYDVVRNKDFFGNAIRRDDATAVENIIRTIAYEAEGALPITGGAVVEGIRTNRPGAEIAEEAVGQFLGSNLRKETPFQERERLVRQFVRDHGLSGIDDYYDMPPALRRQFDEEFPDLSQEIREERERRASMGDPTAIRQVRVQTLLDELMENQQADDARLVEGKIDARTWRENRSIRRAEFYARRSELYEGVRFPEREQSVIDRYFERVEEAKRAHNGVLNADAWDEVDAWVADLDEDDAAFLEANTGLGPFTALERQYREDVATIAPYWDIVDPVATRQAALRERFRRQNPDVDAALIRWGYVSRPVTRAGVDALREIQRRGQPPSPLTPTGQGGMNLNTIRQQLNLNDLRRQMAGAR